jgi:hypothetical protein
MAVPRLVGFEPLQEKARLRALAETYRWGAHLFRQETCP